LHPIKSGGFGEVWVAEDLGGRRVALKKLLDRSDDFVRSLVDEAQKLYRLRGLPGIIQLLDYGLDGHDPFIVLELAEGSLLDHIRGPTPFHIAAEVALQLIVIVENTHLHGVVHRDVKPDNVLVKDGGLRLADFGLGKGAESIFLTMGGAGTPGYMAPEQAVGAPALPTSDVYSVGATLYHIVTGQRPPSDRVNLDPRWCVPACPAQLASLVMRMTSPDPSLRATLADARTALQLMLVSGVLVSPPPARRLSLRPKNNAVAQIIEGIVVGGLVVAGVAAISSLFAADSRSGRRR
jgi:serine/threonine-protein kinase